MEKYWKLKLKFGILKTEFKHFTVLADGEILEIKSGIVSKTGKAWMGMKTWCSSTSEAAKMIKLIAPEYGFNVSGRIEVYDTDPVQPPKENPYGYEINFTFYEQN